jgi:hypothetical protein
MNRHIRNIAYLEHSAENDRLRRVFGARLDKALKRAGINHVRLKRIQDVDMRAKKRKSASEAAWFLKECEVELARGASHIASMLYAESLHAAVRETARTFEISYGRDDVELFLLALAEKLEMRGRPDAAAVVRNLTESGRPPATPQHAENPLSVRRHTASNTERTPLRR